MTAEKTEPKPEAIETKAEMPPSRTGTAKPAVKQASPSDTRQRVKTTPKKPDIILKLLRRPNGARIADLQKATGWQAHSIRAALTGLRKKRIRIELTRTASGKTIYKAVEG